MSTGAKFFLISTSFSVVIAALYWFIAYEPAGTVLLAFLGIAPAIVAAYLGRRARAATFPEDRPTARPDEAAGEGVGPFPSVSAWPLLSAIGAMLVAGGLVYGTWLLVVGAIVFVGALIGFARE